MRAGAGREAVGADAGMARRLFSGLLIGCLIFAGCATKEKPVEGAPIPSPSPAPAQTPAEPKKKGGFSLSAISPLHWIARMTQKQAKPPQAKPPQLIGTVKMVNKEDRFVLIDAISSGATQAGDAMVCIVNQQESARLRAGALRNPPFLIADIASGSPSPGDKVYKP